MRLGVVMDPIAHIKYAKDSTLAMLLAAQARGFELVYMEQRDLVAARRRAPSHASRPLTVRADPQSWFTLGEPRVEPLESLDCILMRKDPPFDTEYIYTTYILERAEAAGVLVVNRPQGLRDMNEKVYTAWFPQCCAPTLITRDMADMEAFLREHGKAVCKPLDGMGGRSIFVVERDDKNMNVIFETLTDYGQRFAIVQRYIPDIVATRRFAGAADRRRAGAVRAGPHPVGDRQPRQSGRRRQGRRPAAERPGPLARRADRPGARRQGHDVRGARRHRRLRHRDQRDEPHGHP